MTTHLAIVDPATRRRSRTLGVFLIVIGLLIYAFFVRSSTAGQLATFGMNPGRQTAALRLPDITLPVLASLYAMSLLSVALGVAQLTWGFRRAEDAVLGLVALLLVLAFLTWAARDQSLNLVGIIEAAVQRAAPIALAALSGVLWRALGVVNIAIEA